MSKYKASFQKEYDWIFSGSITFMTKNSNRNSHKVFREITKKGKLELQERSLHFSI